MEKTYVLDMWKKYVLEVKIIKKEIVLDAFVN